MNRVNFAVYHGIPVIIKTSDVLLMFPSMLKLYQDL